MSDITVCDSEGVRILAVARPQRSNALTQNTIRELSSAFSEAETADSIRAVIITGEQGRFSAGADLDALKGTIEDLSFDDELELLTTQIQTSSMPVAAAVEGVCFGAAIDLAWACDIQVVSATARFGLPAVKLGILYNPVSLARLHSRLGPLLLRRLLVLGDEVSGSELAALGVADLVTPGSATNTALERLLGGPVTGDASAATKALLASLDAGQFDPARWQGRRHDLLALPGRTETLVALRLKVGRRA